MFVRPNDDTLTALARLGKSADWEVLKDWLLKSREDLVQASFSLDEARSRQSQGGAMALDELIRFTTAAVDQKTGR